MQNFKEKLSIIIAINSMISQLKKFRKLIIYQNRNIMIRIL